MVRTGKQPLTWITFAAIMSLSLVVNLPGLAVSPMLGSLSKIFPDTTQLEKQLLTMLPNVLIIPFVLLSGRLSVSRHKVAIIALGLGIYAACAVAYLFASSMADLIVISCLMGVGAGIIVPFSTGLLADTFQGPYLMKEMGFQSGISNMTLVCATFIVGWLGHGNWHLPFVVYLVTLIPLALTPFLNRIPKSELDDASSAPNKPDETVAPERIIYRGHQVQFNKRGFSMSRLLSVVGAYFMVTFLTIVISYYCPYLIEKHDWSESLTGTVTALYFLFIFLPGFFLPAIIRCLGSLTLVLSAASIVVGLALFAFFPYEWVMYVGAILCGFGYGVFQPTLYEKATRVVNNPGKSTLALAIVLTANYGAIVVTPFIIDFFRDITGSVGHPTFAFLFNFIISCVFLISAIIYRRSFVYNPTAQ